MENQTQTFNKTEIEVLEFAVSELVRSGHNMKQHYNLIVKIKSQLITNNLIEKDEISEYSTDEIFSMAVLEANRLLSVLN